MSHSRFCIEQRKKELQRSQKLLTLGLLGSVGVHLLLALAVVVQYQKTTIADDVIELIIIDEPSPVSKTPKPPVKNLKQGVEPKTQIFKSKENKKLALTELSKPEPQSRLVTKIPQDLQSLAPTTPKQPTAPRPEKSSSFSLPSTNNNISNISNKSQPKSFSDNSQRIDQLRTDLNNTLSAPSVEKNNLKNPESLSLATPKQPTAPELGISPPLSIAPSNNNISTISNHSQPKIGLENTSSAPSQPTAPNIETSPVVSIAPTNPNIAPITNISPPKPLSENSQRIEQLKTGLENTSSAPSQPTAPNLETSPVVSIAPTNPNIAPIANISQPKPLSENPQTLEQPKIGLENTSSAPSQPTAPNLETSPIVSIAPTNPNIAPITNISPPKTLSQNPQTIEQLKTGLENTSSAPSVGGSNNQNTQPDIASLTQPKAPQIGTSAPLSGNLINSNSNASLNSSPPGTVSGNGQGMDKLSVGVGKNSSGLSIGGSSNNFSEGNNPGSSSTVAARSSAPEVPKPQGQRQGARCLRQCKPSYPSVLNGIEGSAKVQLIVDSNGDVTKAILVRPNNNSQINEQVLIAARKMKFTAPPNGDRASVELTINFTVAGSEFDRQARKVREQQRRERQAQEREQKARQAQLEQQRQQRQRQLESERAQRERQDQQQQLQPSPTEQL